MSAPFSTPPGPRNRYYAVGSADLASAARRTTRSVLGWCVELAVAVVFALGATEVVWPG